MLALLSWTKLPQWALELILIAVVAGAVWYWQHHLIHEGVAQQKAADKIESDIVKSQAAAKTKELQDRATTAKEAYDQEHADNLAYREQHPDSQPVRLCLSTGTRDSSVSAAGAANSRNENTGTATANVSAVPEGNNSGGPRGAGPDISSLLGLLATKADDVSATLREFQSR